MAELVAKKLIDKEELILTSDCDLHVAYCPHAYCPSSISVCCTKISNRDCYYLSYIPHFHESTIYQAEPSHLSFFLQSILSSHSGLCYWDEHLSLFHFNNPSSFILRSIHELKRNEYIEKSRETLRSLAVMEFGQSVFDDIVNMTEWIDRKF